MDYIIRENYINEIKKFIDKPVIKVITGMRRVGKSTILRMIKEQLLNSISNKHKIYLNFESIELMNIDNAQRLAVYLQTLLKKSKGKLYFFFDEIQLVRDWEKVVNGLQVDYDCDIYITGSNSTLISGELSTLLAGRYVEFEIQPFTFQEFCRIFKDINQTKEELFQQFMKVGGMPFLKYFELAEEPSYKYLKDVYNTVLIKDVLQYNNIRDVDIFQRILSYGVENIGHTFSANSIRNYFKNENRKVSIDTVLNYLEYAKQAFIIKRIPRYDIMGKKILKVDEKYYLTDHGFRSATGYSNIKDIERVLENIICVELISRGYQLHIGKTKDREIDFIARKDKEIIYFQVCYMLSAEKTREREFGVFDEIKDHYPKYVLSMDHLDFSQTGIIHRNIIDFLLDKK